MARKHKARVAYRDRITGRFVSRATWKRSKARGGTRYRRTQVHIAPPRKATTRPKPLPGPITEEEREEAEEELEEVEFQGAFDSPGKGKK